MTVIPTHCCGIQCSSPRKGGGSVYGGPAGGNPSMETLLLHYSTFLLPLSGSQTGEKDGSPGINEKEKKNKVMTRSSTSSEREK